MLRTKSRIVIILALFLLLAVLALSVQLARQKEPIIVKKEAAVSLGQAKVKFVLQPKQGSFTVGSTWQVAVSAEILDQTKPVNFVGIAAYVNYPYGGSAAELSVTNLTAGPMLVNAGWHCLTNSSEDPATKKVLIGIGCLPPDTPNSFLTASQNFVVASFSLTAGRVPAGNPVVLNFDQVETFIIEKDTAGDVVAVDNNPGSYLIVRPTPTPTPTIPPVPPTATPTLIPTPTPTIPPVPPTATPTLVSTSVPTPALAKLSFKIRFQGITEGSKPDQTVRIIFKNGQTFTKIRVVGDAQGVYSGTVQGVIPGTYQVLIKGPVHLQKNMGVVSLGVAETVIKDWSAVVLQVGDFDNNNKLTLNDLEPMQVMWTQFSIPTSSLPPGMRIYDINLDGRFNLADVATARVNWVKRIVLGDD